MKIRQMVVSLQSLNNIKFTRENNNTDNNKVLAQIKSINYAHMRNDNSISSSSFYSLSHAFQTTNEQHKIHIKYNKVYMATKQTPK